MAAVTELAMDVGTSAACRALHVPRASYYGDRRKSSSPVMAHVAAFAGAGTSSRGTGNGLGSSARRTLPGSLARRCLCDVAR